MRVSQIRLNTNKIINVIQNKDLPSCINCIHFMNYKIVDFDLGGKCKKFGYEDFVTGDIDYEYASLSRVNPKLCDNYGKYFVDKNKK
jgi:hypothetical protein